MLVPIIIGSIVVGAAILGWSACVAGARADERDEAHGDLPNLPRGLIRSRPASFRDVTIVDLHPATNRTKGH